MKLSKTLATGALVAATGTSLVLGGSVASAASPTFGTVTVSPATNLVDQQQTNVTVSKFASDDTVYAVECSSSVETTFSESQSCDTSTQATETISDGAGSFKFTVVAGKDFTDSSGDKCDYKKSDSCLIVVADNKTNPLAGTVGFADINFKDTRKADKTKLKANHKSLKKGKKVTLTATTTKAAAKAGGSVKFTFDGKSHTVKDKASGVVKAHFTAKKTGTAKATFEGNSKYKKSSGTVKIKVKK